MNIQVTNVFTKSPEDSAEQAEQDNAEEQRQYPEGQVDAPYMVLHQVVDEDGLKGVEE